MYRDRLEEDFLNPLSALDCLMFMFATQVRRRVLCSCVLLLLMVPKGRRLLPTTCPSKQAVVGARSSCGGVVVRWWVVREVVVVGDNTIGNEARQWQSARALFSNFEQRASSSAGTGLVVLANQCNPPTNPTLQTEPRKRCRAGSGTSCSTWAWWRPLRRQVSHVLLVGEGRNVCLLE